MATYITLLKYTEQGIKSIKESPSRLEKARQLLKSLGGELKSFYLVQGRFDAVVIAEAPNDEVVAKFALASGSQGSVGGVCRDHGAEAGGGEADPSAVP